MRHVPLRTSLVYLRMQGLRTQDLQTLHIQRIDGLEEHRASDWVIAGPVSWLCLCDPFMVGGKMKDIPTSLTRLWNRSVEYSWPCLTSLQHISRDSFDTLRNTSTNPTGLGSERLATTYTRLYPMSLLTTTAWTYWKRPYHFRFFAYLLLSSPSLSVCLCSLSLRSIRFCYTHSSGRRIVFQRHYTQYAKALLLVPPNT